MAIEFHLQMDEGPETESGDVGGHSKQLRYFAHVSEKETYAEVRDAAKDQTPRTYFNLVRTQITVPRRITFDTIFEVIVDYKHPGEAGTPSPQNAGDTRVSVRSEGGGQFQMLFSLDGIRVSPSGASSLSEELGLRAINVDKSGNPQGTPVEGNAIMIIVETLKEGASVTNDFILRAASAKGKVNAFPYKGFPRGSLRLVNFDAQQQANPGGDYVPSWAMNFAFHFEPPYQGKAPMWDYSKKEIVLVPYQREGHWLEDYTKIDRPFDDSTAGVKFVTPVATHLTLHQVHEYEDFETLLGI